MSLEQLVCAFKVEKWALFLQSVSEPFRVSFWVLLFFLLTYRVLLR